MSNKINVCVTARECRNNNERMIRKFNKKVKKEKIIEQVKDTCIRKNIAVGIHVVQPDRNKLKEVIEQGYTFIPYATDGTLLSDGLDNISNNNETLL